MKKRPRSGRLRHGTTSSLPLLAGCCGMVVAAIWAPVARARLLLSAAAIIAVWFRPPDKFQQHGRHLPGSPRRQFRPRSGRTAPRPRRGPSHRAFACPPRRRRS